MLQEDESINLNSERYKNLKEQLQQVKTIKKNSLY